MANVVGSIISSPKAQIDKSLSVSGMAADAEATGKAIEKAKSEAKAQAEAHANQKTNPHEVTAEQVGLGKVDNTSDMDKPVSTAQAKAIEEAKKAGTDAQTMATNAENNAKRYAQAAVENAEKNAKSHGTEVANNAQKNAKEYADSLHKIFTVSLPASGWPKTAPFTQTVALEGILGTDTPHWGVVYSGNAETKLAQKESFAVVDELDTADGSVTFTCLEEKPEVDLTIQLEVNR